MPEFAPIALFVFKRPEHTLRTLQALALNPEFALSQLFVYCDGSRHAGEAEAVERTRKIVRDWSHPAKVLVETDSNRGLASSIIDGVTQLCGQHGRVIVVEDDLIVAPVFLNYMNQALIRYADSEKVMQISGHQFDVAIDSNTDATFLPFTTSWGWATWERAWRAFDPEMKEFDRLAGDKSLRHRFDLGGAYRYFRMLQRQRAGKIDSWAIRWYLSVFSCNGLTLYPNHSLVSNEGFDGSGTHCADVGKANALPLLPAGKIIKFPNPTVDISAFRSVRTYLAKENSLFRKLLIRARASLNYI